MHPLISAWLAYVRRLNEQPKTGYHSPEWGAWLDDCIELEKW